jgi:hypothetical protein
VTKKNIFSRIKDTLTDKERNDEELKLGIAGFYDRSSKLWENVWGTCVLSTIFGLIEERGFLPFDL